MKCPVDNETLMMTDRNGVEIDYCPKCRGVWLDRGELDKIIDRSKPDPVPSVDHSAEPHDRSRSHDNQDHHQITHRKKRGSFLGDLFDF